MQFKRCLVLCPPSARGVLGGTPWIKRFEPYSDAFASGWMLLRGARRRGGYDRGFVLSDHADWPGLHSAIKATQASRVIVTHGSVPVMVRYLTEQGLQAGSFQTEFGDENLEEKQQIAGAETAQSATDLIVNAAEQNVNFAQVST